MSKENVYLVRRLLDMFARRDHEGVFEFYDPDIEWDATAWKSTAVDAGVGGIAGLAGVYRGHGGVRTYWRRWLEAWKDLEFEVEDVLDAGDEYVALIRNQRQVGDTAASSSRWRRMGWCSPFAVARWCAGGFIPTSNRPSKPPGCGSSAFDEKQRFAWMELYGSCTRFFAQTTRGRRGSGDSRGVATSTVARGRARTTEPEGRGRRR